MATDQTVSTDEETLKTISLSATDAESSNLNFSIVNGPSNGSLGSLGAVNCGAGTCIVNVDYTPAANANGTDSFTFNANDGQSDSNTATVDITVNAVKLLHTSDALGKRKENDSCRSARSCLPDTSKNRVCVTGS